GSLGGPTRFALIGPAQDVLPPPFPGGGPGWGPPVAAPLPAHFARTPSQPSRERGKEKAVAQRSPGARFIDSNRSAPSPARGGGVGWGPPVANATPRALRAPPPSRPSPAGGGSSTPVPAPHPCIAPFRRHPCPMYLPSPHDPHDPETQRAADRRRLGAALRGSIAFVLLLL